MASHPPRLKDFDYTGKHHYFLTFCTHGRRRVLVDHAVVAPVSEQLLQSARAHDMAIDAYCCMPDHVHVLAKGLAEASDARAFMAHFKQRSGWRYRSERRGRLWQGSYYDHVLHPEEGLAGVISYIVNNPVRAGLVAAPEEYPFWDSYTQTREGLLEFMKGAGEWKPPWRENTEVRA